MPDSLIRQAASEDLPALSDLDEVAGSDSDRRDFIRDAIEEHRAWVLEASTRVVGYGIISHGFFGRSFLELVYIAESHRSRGYGPNLIAFLEERSRSDDFFTSTNQSNSHMQHVLEKLGYERSGIIHNLDPGDPEIVYVKRSVHAKRRPRTLTMRQALGHISPFFIVSDVPEALRFYVEDLGFEVRYSEPQENPFFAIVGRDAVQILLKAVSDEISALPNHTRHEWAPWDAFVFVSEPDQLASELASRNVEFHKEVGDRDDGLRGFELCDNDGYVLFFGRPR